MGRVTPGEGQLVGHPMVAVIAASERAHNPYRDNRRVQLVAPKISFKTRIVSRTLKLFARVLATLRVWQKPAGNRRTIRRAVRTSLVQAKNKADPHLAKRV